jgi:hypothetical protein
MSVSASHRFPGPGVRTRVPAERRRTEVAVHAFKVGQLVSVRPQEFLRTSRAVEQALYSSNFEITRLLPVSGPEFQYRVRNAATGQERVVTESEIATAD